MNLIRNVTAAGCNVFKHILCIYFSIGSQDAIPTSKWYTTCHHNLPRVAIVCCVRPRSHHYANTMHAILWVRHLSVTRLHPYRPANNLCPPSLSPLPSLFSPPCHQLPSGVSTVPSACPPLPIFHHLIEAFERRSYHLLLSVRWQRLSMSFHQVPISGFWGHVRSNDRVERAIEWLVMGVLRVLGRDGLSRRFNRR